MCPRWPSCWSGTGPGCARWRSACSSRARTWTTSCRTRRWWRCGGSWTSAISRRWDRGCAWSSATAAVLCCAPPGASNRWRRFRCRRTAARPSRSAHRGARTVRRRGPRLRPRDPRRAGRRRLGGAAVVTGAGPGRSGRAPVATPEMLSARLTGFNTPTAPVSGFEITDLAGLRPHGRRQPAARPPRRLPHRDPDHRCRRCGRPCWRPVISWRCPSVFSAPVQEGAPVRTCTLPVSSE